MATSAIMPFPYRLTPLTNLAPFTYREGETYLSTLERLRVYVLELIPEFNSELTLIIADFQAGIANVENTIVADRAAAAAVYDAFVAAVNAEVDLINNRVGPVSIQRATLTDNTYTVTVDPSWPTDHPVTFVLTQDGTGGRTVTLGAGVVGPLALNTTPNTKTVFTITPDGAGVWNVATDDSRAAAVLTAGTATIAALDTRYHTKTEAAATYETLAGAAGTYETLAGAAATYETLAGSAGKVSKGAQAFNVKDYGATGDGTTDDTDAINAAIVAGAGRVVIIPKGTYMIDAIKNVAQGSQPTGIMVTAAGTTLRFEQGAVFQAKTNNSTGYAVIQVTAPDCLIEGGTVNGDMLLHGDTGGEFGHCIELAAGADRSVIRGTRVQYAWGDGVLVWGRPADVALIGVVADSNRRQGASIIDAVRPRVIGCTFQNTGRTKFTAPAAGLDIEPDPGTARDVIDALISGNIFRNNAGAGFLIVSQGRTASATVTGNLATGNAGSGYHTARGDVAGSPNVQYSGCESRSNTLHGYAADGGVANVRYTGCTAEKNTLHGFFDSAADSTRVIGCVALKNGAAGVYSDSLSSNLAVSGSTATGNCTTQSAMANYDLNGAGPLLTGNHSHAGAGPTYPGFAYAVRAGAINAQVVGCTAIGAYGTRAWTDAAEAYVNPVPGDVSRAARAEFTPPRTLTATGPISVADSLVVCDIAAGGALTSLPDPTLVKGGVQFTVKNVNATSLGVISQGASKTIDGAAQVNLAQWAKITVTTDGTRWLTL